MKKPCHFGRSALCSISCLAIFALTAHAGPELSYNLSLDGDLWGNPFSSRLRLDDDFRLSGMNMSMSGFGFRTEAGDIFADWDELGLAGHSFQGIKTGFDLGKADVSLLGGTVILQPDILRQPDLLKEKDVSSVVSLVYGVRASLPITRRVSLNASQLLTPRAPNNQGEGITTLGLSYRPSIRQRLALELARSQQGSGWQIAGATERGRLKLQGSYRQVDQGFSTAGNPALRTRRNGGRFNLEYRIAQPLTLHASTQRYKDGWGGHTKFDNVNLRFAKRDKPALQLFWRAAEIKRSTARSAGTKSTSSDTTGFRLNHKIGVDRVAFQYSRNRYLAADDEAKFSATTNRFILSWARPLGKQTQMSLTQALDLGKSDEGKDSRTSVTSLDLRHRVGKSGLMLDLGIQYANRLVNDKPGQALFLRTGLNYQFKSGSSVGLQYRTRVVASGPLDSISTDRLYLSYSHRFGSRKRGAKQFSREERRQHGKIVGRVFEDKNVNGTWDEGELGIATVTIRKYGNSPLETDQDGRFQFADIRPGEYRLQLVTKTLPIELTTLTSTELTVNVPAGKSVTVNFPVVRSGHAKGIVFLDINRNGTRDIGEEGVRDAVVQVEGSAIIGFTDAKGNFALYGLPPKTWSISVNVEVLGEEMVATGAGVISADIPANGEVTGIELGIAPKERTVINTFEKTL